MSNEIFESYQEISRDNYGVKHEINDGIKGVREAVKIGALLRIAESLELFTDGSRQLKQSLDHARESRERYEEDFYYERERGTEKNKTIKKLREKNKKLQSKIDKE